MKKIRAPRGAATVRPRTRIPLVPLALLGVVAALLLTATAKADIVTARDDDGRSIRFDVRADGVDVEWYANLLRRAAHGDEISTVTIRIVTPETLARSCGSAAGGCYSERRGSAVIVLPSAQTTSTAHTLLHEYAHHIDATHSVPGAREPNGTPSWWAARDMESLLESGQVARDYSNGWSRAIGEIFAEDYAQMHIQAPYKIGWLSPPGASVRNALRADLEGVPARPAVPPPVVILREGVIAGGETRTLPFGLLGTGRRVTFTISVKPEAGGAAQGRAELRCGERTFAKNLTAAGALKIDRRNLGPGSCEIAFTSTSTTPQAYEAKLRLAVEA